MKSNLKMFSLYLIIFGISFALLPVMDYCINSKIGNNVKDREYSENSRTLKTSATSEKIHIIGNSGWVDFKNAGQCTGSGTYSNPYVIEDLVIDSEGPGNCIEIEDSYVYFKIENCTIYNSGTSFVDDGGIRLVNVTHGIVTNNTCTSIYRGISVGQSNNIIISGNRAYNNSENGIYLWFNKNDTVSGNIVNNNGNDGIYLHDNCYNNTVSGNTVNNNGDDGIYIIYGIDNIITGNTISHNGDDGIFLRGSNTNIVSGNTFIGNQECITEADCRENVFSDNGSCNYGEDDEEQVIPGFELYILLGTLVALSIIIQKKILKDSKLK